MTDLPEFPEGHPLAGKEGLLDTHASHLEAYAEVLADADGDDTRAAMVVIADDDGIDTLPTVAADADPRKASLWMLGAHISHVAGAGSAASGEVLTMEEVAEHAIVMVREHRGPTDVYGGEEGGGSA